MIEQDWENYQEDRIPPDLGLPCGCAAHPAEASDVCPAREAAQLDTCVDCGTAAVNFEADEACPPCRQGREEASLEAAAWAAGER